MHTFHGERQGMKLPIFSWLLAGLLFGLGVLRRRR